MGASGKSLQPNQIIYKLASRNPGGGPRSLRDRGRHGRLFLPGEPVPETGIYEVIHDQAHRTSHEVVMHGQDLFPACDQCDQRVRFRLIRTAPYIFDDEDFIEET